MKEKYKALKEYITIRTSERKIIEWFDKQPLSEWVTTGSIPTDKA